MFQFDAVEADADFRGILDWRVTDIQVEKTRRLRLIIGSAAGAATGGQRECKDTCQSDTGLFNNSGHLIIPHDLGVRYVALCRV